MLSDIWPVYRLQVATGRLNLRLPNEQELAEVAEVAGAGVHRDSERPFLMPWTEGSAQDRARNVVRGHWSGLANWTAASWGLGLCVFQDKHASQGVSRKLGYEPDGISRDARGDDVLVSDRLRLTRQNWLRSDHPRAEVTGFEPCRPWFGV